MPIQRLGQHTGQKSLLTPNYAAKVPAGFPSPADDYMDKGLDLNEHLIKHPAATFFCRVSGESMRDVGIFDGDLLIVDRAIKPMQGNIVLAAINGELTCKILDINARCLLPSNDNYPPIPIEEGVDFSVEGVITHSIRDHRVRTG